MKQKTITKILTGKFLSWSKSIDDEPTRKLVEKNTIITGGAIASMLMGEMPNDFDVYFTNSETAKAVAEYYVAKLKANPPAAFEAVKDDISVILEPAIEAGQEARRVGGYAGLLTKGPQPPRVRIVVGTDRKKILRGEEVQQAHEDYTLSAGEVTDNTEPATYEGNAEALDGLSPKELSDKADEKKRGKYRVLFVTANAITLSDKIQIVLRFTGDVDEIHENYDFEHCCAAWDSKTKELHLRTETLLAIMAKELKYRGSRYPIASCIRSRKFITRGWTINAGQYVKIAYQIAQLDLNDPAVLEDQLVGVDSAYFSMLIRSLSEQMEKRLEADPNAAREIDGNHLISLIDKIF
jgi:hypothetical protein